MSLFSEKGFVLISGLMSNLIKKSWTDSSVHFRRQFTKPFSKWFVKVTGFFSRFQAALSLMTAAQPHDPSNIFFISKRKKVLRKKLVVYKMTSLMQEQCNEIFFLFAYILGQQPKVQEIKELYQVQETLKKCEFFLGRPGYFRHQC